MEKFSVEQKITIFAKKTETSDIFSKKVLL